MLSLLNRVARGIEDAWTAGFFQLFMVAILAYWVAGGIVSDFEIAKEQAAVEERFNRENGTHIHVGGENPELPKELWDRAPALIAITFIVVYEIRRRIKHRRDTSPRSVNAEDHASIGVGATQVPSSPPFSPGVGTWAVAISTLIGLPLLFWLFFRLAWKLYAWTNPRAADYVSRHPFSAFESGAVALVIGGTFLVAIVRLQIWMGQNKRREGVVKTAIIVLLIAFMAWVGIRLYPGLFPAK